MKSQNEQQQAVVDEFTQKAEAFAKMPGHEEVLSMMLEMVSISPNDTLLDVACGGGGVTCALATRLKKATGIDITPPMIEKAKKLQRDLGISNVSWCIGSVMPLPFPDQSFSLVICRYAFHHFTQPLAVLEEMVRVCCNGGSVMLVDIAVPMGKRNAYNDVERMKDSSHVSAMTPEEFLEMAEKAELRQIKTRSFALPMKLSAQLKPSLKVSQVEKIRSAYEADVGKNNLGVEVRLDGDEVYFDYPSIILTGKKKA